MNLFDTEAIMKTAARTRDVALVIVIAILWTLVVIAFSTTMGARPLRIYDWGPPVFAGLVTLCCMARDRLGAPSGG